MTSLARRMLLSIIIVSGALAGCGAAEHGADSAQAVIDAYVAGLNAKDAEAISYLTLAIASTDAAIQSRIHDHGGQNITLSRTDLTHDLSPNHVRAELHGTGTAGPYTETFDVDAQDGRWYLAIDPANPVVKTPQAQTVQPS